MFPILVSSTDSSVPLTGTKTLHHPPPSTGVMERQQTFRNIRHGLNSIKAHDELTAAVENENAMKQREPYKPTLEDAKRVVRDVLRRNDPTVPTYMPGQGYLPPRPHWSEYPPHNWQRDFHREMAEEWEELNYRYRSVPCLFKRAPDRVLEFPGDYQVPPGLSQRERELLVLIARGHSSRVIATLLDLKLTTVYLYRSKLARKLGCRRFTYAKAREILGLPYREPKKRRRAS